MKNTTEYTTEIVTVDEDIKVLYVTAISFPEGIEDAYKRLDKVAPGGADRRYFGISRPENGRIIYRAAAQQKYDGEAADLGCESLTIKSGKYISVVLKDYEKNISKIAEIFQELTSYPDIDRNGYCLERFLSEKDIRCMVPLKS